MTACTNSSKELDKRNPTWRQTYTTGWRFGVVVSAVSTSCVFIVNLTVLIWAVRKFGLGNEGRQILYAGSCNTVKTLNRGIHLAINVLSTILLASSNYCMQCLSAPTRTDIDTAHQSKNWPRWLDIGVPSIRNLWRIDRKRVIIWTILSLSSLPLHLL